MVELAEIPECHTYGNSLSRARSKIREALGLWVDDADSAEIVDDIRLPTKKAVEVAAAARQQAEQASQKAMAVQLRAAGLSTRDTAELSGLSQQRIAQLTAQLTAQK